MELHFYSQTALWAKKTYDLFFLETLESSTKCQIRRQTGLNLVLYLPMYGWWLAKIDVGLSKYFREIHRPVIAIPSAFEVELNGGDKVCRNLPSPSRFLLRPCELVHFAVYFDPVSGLLQPCWEHGSHETGDAI